VHEGEVFARINKSIESTRTVSLMRFYTMISNGDLQEAKQNVDSKLYADLKTMPRYLILLSNSVLSFAVCKVGTRMMHALLLCVHHVDGSWTR